MNHRGIFWIRNTTILFILVLCGLGPLAPAQASPCSGAWQRVETPRGGAPSARYGAAMAYDVVNGAVVLFGGLEANGVTFKGDTWIWNGAAWTQASSTGPAARLSHSMAYDSARGRVVLFGGLSQGALMNDTWEWNGSSWANVTPLGAKPGPRTNAAMTYDSGRGRIILFGGFDNSNNTLADTWEWNGSSWAQITSPGPSARERAALAYDPVRRVSVLFGGAPNNDVWEWNGAAWSQKTGAGPSPRSSATMAYNTICGSVFLFGGEGGGHRGDTWSWDGTSWTQLATTGPAPRTQHAMAYDSGRGRVVLFGGSGTEGIVNDTWEWVSPCDDEAAVLDRNGNVEFPPNLDESEPPVYEDVDEDLGLVENVDPSAEPGLDTWYENLSCNASIGGTVPREASNPDLAGDLASLGILGVTPQEIAEGLDDLQEVIADKAAQETERLSTAGPLVSGPYVPPAASHCKESGCSYVFGGRDIIFVHGLRMDPLFDKMFSTNPGAFTQWPNDKAAFYGSGYWKQGAERYWADHIKKFLTDKGFKNRYLIVAYPSTQRLEVGAQAILTQIADAMMTGEGVVDLSGRNDRSGFGTPSYVVISHSTGGLITDIAMTAATQHLNLGVDFIPRYAKGHIALDAAFNGSRLATAAIALAGYATFVNPPPAWLCPVANLGVLALNASGSNNPQLGCPPNFLVLADSILVDLVPAVAQLKWGSSVRSSPLRTLTVAGAHPTYIAPFKHILHLGYDDGVTNVESQIANPNTTFFWPSGFTPTSPFGLVRVFDMGVFRTYPLRAIGYYIDQVGDRLLNPLSVLPHPALVAAGPTPYVSPTGMVQPVQSQYGLTGGYNPLRRSPNHFSFLFSAADHFGGSTGPFNDQSYRDSFGERNWEETRVITDPAVFQPYPMVYPGDDAPLIAQGQVPPVEETVKGRKVTFRIRIFGRKFEKTWWIWKRRYHLLSDWQNKVQMDYVYGSVLTQSGIATCQPPGISQPPVSQTVTAGQSATFTVTVAGPGSFSYQWRFNGGNLTNGGPISGATTSVLKIQPASAAQAGLYDVVVTSGCSQTVSGRATLTVSPTPVPPCVLDPGLIQAGLTHQVRAVLAQTFRPAKDGVLIRILHGLRKHPTISVQAYNLYITTTAANGQPSWPNGVLYSAKGLTLFASGNAIDGAVPLVNGPKLSTATTYALVLEPVGPGMMLWRGNSSAGAYAKGAAYQRGNQWALSSAPKDLGFKLEGSCCQPAACVLDPGLRQAGITASRRATLAQTFKPAQNGALVQVVHGLRKGSSSAAKYNLYITTTNTNGQPSWPNGVLYSIKRLSAFATGTGIDGVIPIPGNLQLSTSTTYALVLEPAAAGDMYWRGNSSPSSYPNGAAFEWNPTKRQWNIPTTGPKDHGFRVDGSCCK
jgi:Immunoglobulin domain/Galactose oxidase, central domain